MIPDDVERMKFTLQGIARQIGKAIPPGMGFALLLFQFGEGDDKWMTYASNAERQGMIDTMKEFIAKWESGEAGPPPKRR
jgi:hypothetical protein